MDSRESAAGVGGVGFGPTGVGEGTNGDGESGAFDCARRAFEADGYITNRRLAGVLRELADWLDRQPEADAGSS